MLSPGRSSGDSKSPTETEGVPNSGSPAALRGTLPSAESRTARITADGRLVIGKVSFSAESVAECLRSAGKLSAAMRSYFQGPNEFNILIPDDTVVLPLASENMSAAMTSLDDVFGDGLFCKEIHPWEVALRGSVKERILKPAELMELRKLLRMGAQIATACCGVDETMVHRHASASNVRKSLDVLYRLASPTANATARYLQKQPFKEYDPHFLRLELDKWAQRIELRRDGSPIVYCISEREAVARKIFEAGPCIRTVSLTDGAIVSSLTVRQEGTGVIILDSRYRLNDLYSILSLAKTASNLLQDLDHQGVDLVRLCSLADRDSFLRISRCVKSVFPHTHIRLDGIDTWAPRFDVGKSEVLSTVDVAELAALLLDAEAVLFTVSHLQAAVLGEENESLWRSKWTRAKNDKEYRTALALVSAKPAPLECQCDEAAETAASAALILGYSSEERTGDLRNIPQSPLQSIAWMLDQRGSSSQEKE